MLFIMDTMTQQMKQAMKQLKTKFHPLISVPPSVLSFAIAATQPANPGPAGCLPFRIIYDFVGKYSDKNAMQEIDTAVLKAHSILHSSLLAPLLINFIFTFFPRIRWDPTSPFNVEVIGVFDYRCGRSWINDSRDYLVRASRTSAERILWRLWNLTLSCVVNGVEWFFKIDRENPNKTHQNEK